MEKEFKVRMNTATAIFLTAYTIYIIGLAVTRTFGTLVPVGIAGIVFYIFFLGLRPYKYTLDKKTLSIHYRLWKAREIDLMQAETICDPVSRWADIATRPHAIEIYTDARKRYCFFPKKRVDFVTAVMQANKRIHCTVKDYTDIHRQIEKKLRKERIRASKKNATGQKEKESK
ncbi:MAG: hypothetical protein RR428_09375 [Coprobacillus sp.]